MRLLEGQLRAQQEENAQLKELKRLNENISPNIDATAHQTNGAAKQQQNGMIRNRSRSTNRMSKGPGAQTQYHREPYRPTS